MKDIYIFLVLVLLLQSCFSKEKVELVASVYNNNLLLSEVISEMPNQIRDSAYFVEKFINDWVRKELMISHAELNLSSESLDIKKEIDDYRASLLIFAYQQELLNQNFDSLIDLFEIEDYYKEYKNEFKLNKNIFKGRFIVVDKLAPDLNLVDKWYKSEKRSSVESLEDYCQQFSKKYYLDDDNWQYFSIFNRQLPNFINEEEYFLRNTKGIWFDDDTFRYYIFVKDYQIRGSISPFIVEKEKIKNVLLNKKKIEYLKQIEDELFQNALANKNIKIY